MIKVIFGLLMKGFIRKQLIKGLIFLIGAGTGVAMARDAKKAKNNVIENVRNSLGKTVENAGKAIRPGSPLAR